MAGSMRKSDVLGSRNRSDAVWVTLALDVIGNQLRSGSFCSTDIVTVIGMNDHGAVLVDKEPFDWLLFNTIVDCGHICRPRSHGQYLPALDLAASFLGHNPHGNCALMLTFLSDGKPSDMWCVWELVPPRSLPPLPQGATRTTDIFAMANVMKVVVLMALPFLDASNERETDHM
jgi:hypothetical protein